jgi:hypothetical protein
MIKHTAENGWPFGHGPCPFIHQPSVDIPFRNHILLVLDKKKWGKFTRHSKGPKDRQRLDVLEDVLKKLKEGSLIQGLA